MYYRYRRNADENIRELERRYHAGDPEMLEPLVRAYLRSGNLSVPFLVEHPEIFAFLPEDWQYTLWQMSRTPPRLADPGRPDYCWHCLSNEGNEHQCPGVLRCPCCEIPDGPLPQNIEDYDEYDIENEEDEEDEDPNNIWECANCGEDLSGDDENEEWAILSDAAATITTHQISRGEGGQAMCESCLNEAGLDLEEAVQNELPDYCSECGEQKEDCPHCERCGEEEDYCEC